MKLAIVGTGYVGLVTGTCFAELGLSVYCVDSDETKIEVLKSGNIPIYEEGLEALVKRNMQAGRLFFSTKLAEILPLVDIIFIAVGTPPQADGSANLSAVYKVAEQIGASLEKHKLIVVKSTVPPGTTDLVRSIIEEKLYERRVKTTFDVASNPEFLKEGSAVADFMKPDRVIVGVNTDFAKEVMTQLYRPMLLNNFRVIFMDIISAELTKYASNAMLATRISFMNDIASLSERLGADIECIRQGVGSDSRIGNKFLYAGCGYGGSCFPKDVKALIATGRELGHPLRVLEAVDAVNEAQKRILFSKFYNYYGGDVAQRKVAIWGLSFKPGTNDVREAPSLVLINQLLEANCQVTVYDPIASQEVYFIYKDRIAYAQNMYEGLNDADALFHVTEWKEFRMPDRRRILKAMKNPLIIDGRNVFEPSQWMGFTLLNVGRASSENTRLCE